MVNADDFKPRFKCGFDLVLVESPRRRCLGYDHDRGPDRSGRRLRLLPGKTVDLIVGNSPGGGFDIYARTIAQHLGGHIPGNPAIVVKNMPGAGGARAGHYISTISPKDGLTIGAIMPGTIMGPLLDEKPDMSFDPTKVDYLGTANTGTYICVTLGLSKTKTFEQALTQKTIMGGIAAGNSTNDIANMIKKMTGRSSISYLATRVRLMSLNRARQLDGVCGWS